MCDRYRIIVSGGRDFDDIDAVAGLLIQYEYSPSWVSDDEKVFPRIVHGGCNMQPVSGGGVRYRNNPPLGADAIADYLARRWGWPEPDIYWSRSDECGPPSPHQRHRFGAVRQHAMALSGGDLCVLFPGGRGTANMGRCAEAAAIPVVNVSVTDQLRHRGRKYVHRVR